MRSIGEPKPIPEPSAKRPVWGFIEDLEPGHGVFVTGYAKKSLSRVRDRFKAVGISISVYKAEENGVQGYRIRRN